MFMLLVALVVVAVLAVSSVASAHESPCTKSGFKLPCAKYQEGIGHKPV